MAWLVSAPLVTPPATSNLAKRDKIGRLVRNYTGRVVLEVSIESIRNKLLECKVMKITAHRGKEVWKAIARYSLKDCDDLEIWTITTEK